KLAREASRLTSSRLATSPANGTRRRRASSPRRNGGAHVTRELRAFAADVPHWPLRLYGGCCSFGRATGHASCSGFWGTALAAGPLACRPCVCIPASAVI